jgi:predicted RNase H-like nuclease
MSGNRYIGIDGCRAGWFYVQFDDHDKYSYHLAENAGALDEIVHGASSALIDIPIGLLSEGSNGRECDVAARRLLSGRAGSVFPAPARQTLTAKSYQEALQFNRQATGRGLSKQAWNIVPKIREIDSLLAANPGLRGGLRECHPELCFWAFNGEQAMQHSKKTAPGRQERLAVLDRHHVDCRPIYEQAAGDFLRREVALDDIIDALVCALTAKLGYGCYSTVPGAPGTDATGLAMEMVYWSE